MTGKKTDKQLVEKVGGWKRLSKELVYENPWIEVSHEEVLRPNGSEGIYGLVHFKGRALGIVAIDENGCCYLVKQSRYALNEASIELPEGGGSMEESLEQAAARELEEECGLIAAHWQPLLKLHMSNSITDESAYVFVATGLSPGKQALEDTEDIEVLHLPLKEAVAMAMDGRITDAISVAALFRVALDPQFKVFM
ncbi:NUDIX domain-containing protein [Agaribacterium sp. ZY112]|uniref:NUDIX domain-containing protein n=1 Tax=Agaribacterium sp. ZY112 TaxID=3233574 RepID=UPI0035239893